MQQKKSRFVVFLCLFFFHSISDSFALGIDFIERTSFNRDESGKFSIKVDLTKVGSLISVIKYLKGYESIAKLIGDNNTLRVGYNAFCAAQEKIKNIPGISAVRVKHDEKMLTLILKFEFENIQVLNKAVKKINKGIDHPKLTCFSLSDELFVREDMNGIAKKLIFYQQHDNCPVKSLDLDYFFKDTTYTTIYTFHKKIVGFSNPLSVLTKDKKGIRVTHHVFAADETEESIGNRVRFEQ